MIFANTFRKEQHTTSLMYYFRGNPLEKMLKFLKVHILYEQSNTLRPHSSSYIRLLLPLTHPANADAFIVSQGTACISADVVIVERKWKPGISLRLAEDLVEQVRRQGARLIYAIDDNLLDLKLEESVWKGLTTEEMMVVRYFAREANGIIVSTDCLKDRMAQFNKKIAVVPNALDERLVTNELPRPNATISNGRKVIGYIGTYTHNADLMMILQALRETLRKHQNTLELQLVGEVADPAVIQAFDGLPIRILDVGDNDEYPAFMRWMIKNVHWDIAIEPLEDNPVTRCQSDLKFLNYSALGITGIYSKVLPYEKTVRHLETGYIATNNTEAWVEAFSCLLNDDSLRQNMARKAQEYVFSARTLKHCAQNWRSAIFSIVN